MSDLAYASGTLPIPSHLLILVELNLLDLFNKL